jgi:hypothetical protein
MVAVSEQAKYTKDERLHTSNLRVELAGMTAGKNVKIRQNILLSGNASSGDEIGIRGKPRAPLWENILVSIDAVFRVWC